VPAFGRGFSIRRKVETAAAPCRLPLIVKSLTRNGFRTDLGKHRSVDTDEQLAERVASFHESGSELPAIREQYIEGT